MGRRFVCCNEKIKQTNSLQRVKNILALYDDLIEGGVDKARFCKGHKISERTFTRYLSIIGRYLETEDGNYMIVADGDYYEITDSF